MKRVFYIALLLLATSMLLAHEVIPHHHHNGEIHFDSHSCEHSQCQFPSEDEEDDHSESKCCALFEYIVLLPGYQNPLLDFSVSNNGSDNSSNLFTTPLNLYSANGALNVKFLLGIWPYIDSHYLSYEGWSQSLRAPPLA